MDYMAALSKANFGAHGYAASFVLSGDGIRLVFATYIYADIHSSYIHTHTHTFTQSHINTHIHSFTLSHAYKHKQIYLYPHIHTLTHIYTHMYYTVFDREWKAGLPLAAGLEIIRKCLHELRTRFLISQPVFVIKIVDKDGTRNVTL